MSVLEEEMDGADEYWRLAKDRRAAEFGGPEATRRLLALPEASDGWKALYERGRLDLTVECQVLRDEFAPLFTDAERAIIAAEWLEGTVSTPNAVAEASDVARGYGTLIRLAKAREREIGP